MRQAAVWLVQVALLTLALQPPSDEPLVLFAADPDGNSLRQPSDSTNPAQNTDIWVANANGSDARRLTDSPRDDHSPAPSPDGSRIAFVSTRDGTEQIYVMNLDGSGQRKLTSAPGSPAFGPTWSPDGAHIAFSANRGGTTDIYTIGADGSSERRLTRGPDGNDSPAWSPDGSLLAYASVQILPGTDQVTGSLWVMAGDGSNPRKLVDDAGSPAWSPDGQRIGFVGERNEGTVIGTIRPDGRDQRIIVDAPGLNVEPSWTPDSRRLAYAHTDAAPPEPLRFDVVVLDADGSNPTTITAGPASNFDPEWFVPSRPIPAGVPTAAPGTKAAPTTQPPIPNAAVRTSSGVVATDSPDATAAALSVLEDGGNAVDAAIAAVFAVGVTRPEMCGIGGGGFALVRMADGRVGALDYRETAPGAIEPDAFQGDGIHRQLAGHKTVGVPGIVAGMQAARARFGTRSLAALIAPAERLARQGFPVSPLTSRYMAMNAERFRLFPATAKLYLRGSGDPYPPGSRLVLADYAKSLRLVAEQGPDAFYRGEIARLILRDMAENAGRHAGDEGLLSAEDLASYKPIWREPLAATYRGHQVLTLPPPTAGGLVVVESLNLLEGFDMSSMGAHSADRLHLTAEAAKAAWADRDAYVADPDFADVPTEELASKQYSERRRGGIRMEAAAGFPPGLGTPAAGAAAGTGTARVNPASHTSHVSVMDAGGNAAAFTCTVETIFGSAVVPPGAGFILNNELTDFSEPGTANAPEPGKRPRSSITPLIVVKDERTILTIGGAGGTWIPLSVTTVLSNLIDFGMPLEDAMSGPRVHEWYCCELFMEEATLEPDVRDELRERGHQIRWEGRYAEFPVLQAVGVDPATGEHVAFSDPRGQRGAGAQEEPRPTPPAAVIVVIAVIAALLLLAVILLRRRLRRRRRAV